MEARCQPALSSSMSAFGKAPKNSPRQVRPQPSVIFGALASRIGKGLENPRKTRNNGGSYTSSLFRNPEVFE